MRFDRSKRRIQGCSGLDVGQSAAVAERNAYPLDGRERAQGFVQIDSGDGAGIAAADLDLRLGRRRHQVQVGVATPAPDVESGCDALDPVLERSFAPEVADLLVR